MSDRMTDERFEEYHQHAVSCGGNFLTVANALCAERTFAKEQKHRLAICEAKESVARAAYENLLAAATVVCGIPFTDTLEFCEAMNVLRAIIENGQHHE